MSNLSVTRSWSSLPALLNPDFGIPTDVTFQVLNPAEDGSQPIEVKAHRLILGFLSPVFRRQFFGLALDTQAVIPVKGTTKKAFETMVDFIYGKNIIWEEMSLKELFDVVNMAEMYIIPELMENVKKPIATFDLSEDNLIEAAAMAEGFEHFKETSDTLLSRCQGFLKDRIRTVQDAAEFAAKHASTEFENVAFKLLASLRNMNTSQECPNCGNFPCMEGTWVTDFETLFVGCLLRRQTSRYTEFCKVVEIFGALRVFSVVWDQNNPLNRGYSDYPYPLGLDLWKYSCKNAV